MTAPVVGPTRLSGDDARLDALVNVEGIDQLTASQMLWAPHLVTPVVEPAFDAPRAEQLRWARLRAGEIVRQGLWNVLVWLGIESNPMEIYRRAKGEPR